jgi:hypothetical protein
LSAVLSPADIVVSVLTPSVLELQGHPDIRPDRGELCLAGANRRR